MAKDNREIVRGISLPVAHDAEGDSKHAKVFTPSMEDELAAALTQEQLDAAVERGDLTGDWKHISEGKAKSKAKEAKE